MIELLAPAGNMAKMRAAFDYGADAVYIGGGAYSLRANAGNFTQKEIADAVSYANSINKKIYVTANIIARNSDLAGIERYAKELAEAGVHGVIVSDPGVFMTVKSAAPDIPIHISTQANSLNYRTCEYWYRMGAVRVNVARELTLSEIAEINASLKLNGCPIELEAFVHGAMCMSYSGRCMLSDYLTSRSSNRGDCAQPCRWKYGIRAFLTEESRPGEMFEAEENDRGTFIFNSYDLCMIDHLKELKDAGVVSFKIEGRMKSEFYTAVTVRAYRMAIDALERGEPVTPGTPEAQQLISELTSVSHRAYSTGFYIGERGRQIYDTSSYSRDSDFIGTVDSCRESVCDCTEAENAAECVDTSIYTVTVTQRGTFSLGDTLEFVPPKGDILKYTVCEMRNIYGEKIDRAPHAMMKVIMNLPFRVPEGCVIRRRKSAGGQSPSL